MSSFTAVDVLNLARDLREDAEAQWAVSGSPDVRPSRHLVDYIDAAAALLRCAEAAITAKPEDLRSPSGYWILPPIPAVPPVEPNYPELRRAVRWDGNKAYQGEQLLGVISKAPGGTYTANIERRGGSCDFWEPGLSLAEAQRAILDYHYPLEAPEDAEPVCLTCSIAGLECDVPSPPDAPPAWYELSRGEGSWRVFHRDGLALGEYSTHQVTQLEFYDIYDVSGDLALIGNAVLTGESLKAILDYHGLAR